MRTYFIIILIFSSSVLFGQVTGLAGWDIFLDPGHSQKENMGIYNYSEAEKVVRVGLALRELLLTTTDIDTVYICRDDDTDYVSLSQRTDRANSLGAAWYHSIHSDAGSATVNTNLLLWGQYASGVEKVPGGGQGMSAIMIEYLNNGYRSSGRSWGDCSFYGCSSGGPYLHVNRTTTMPSELSEAGFHTNPAQNQRNMNQEWKKLEAYIFYWSILKYHGLAIPPVGIVCGIIRDLESQLPINGASVNIHDQIYTTDTYESLFYKYSNDPEQLRNGFYFIEGVPPQQTADIIVTATDYYPDTTSVFVIDSFFTFQDISLVSTVPPTIISSEPTPNDSTYKIDNPIVVYFSRPMDTASVSAAWDLNPDCPGIFKWNSSRTSLTFTPVALSAETQYQLTIQATAHDQYNHPLDGNGDQSGGDAFVLNFHTGYPDVLPPEIINVNPTAGSLDIELNPIITLVFNEPLDSLFFYDTSFVLSPSAQLDDTVQTVMHYYTCNSRGIVSLYPQIELQSNTRYRARINRGLKDRYGNILNRTSRYYFTTGAYRYMPRVIDNFDSDPQLGNWFVPQQSGSTTGIITDSTYRSSDSSIAIPGVGTHYSMRLDFGWDTTDNDWLIREYLSGGSPRYVQFTAEDQLQVYIFGDSSLTLFRFAVDDGLPAESASHHEVSEWISIDWYGWRLVSWDLASDPVGSWLGNGVLENNLRFDSFQLSWQPGAKSSGTLYFDDLRVAQVAVDVNEAEGLAQLSPITRMANYPNPFNAQTRIEFELPRKEHVTIHVYDMLGERIETLLDQVCPAGKNAIIFDATPFPSGVLFYQLKTEQSVLTQKMLLLK